MAQSSTTDVNNVSDEEQSLPPIAAAFLVTFDNRKGYTLSWRKSLDTVELDGAVEFKCLPSGLHNVTEDLVYFVLDDHAGISAFIRQDDEQAARNARMLSVGVLVPFEAGRMGKSFLYAPKLKELASTLISADAKYTPLDEFWEKHKKTGENASDSSDHTQTPEGYQKLRSLSTSTSNIGTEHPALPSHHPALALPHVLQLFGPLIFPMLKAALLQRRILILGEAPVETTCNFVYCMSILSSISRSLVSQVPKLDAAQARLRPLFSVGISDIPVLEGLEGPWIACTTDDVLASKPQLFDLLVILPNASALQKHGNKTYPKLVESTEELSRKFPQQGWRATQRDARRFTALRKGLATVPSGAAAAVHAASEDDPTDTASVNSTISAIVDQREAVEPMQWSVIAYTSLIWWASAGDSRSGLVEAEELAVEQDEALLRECLNEEGVTKEVAMVAYFHKLSTMMFTVLSNAVRRSGVDQQTRYRDDEPSETTSGDDQQALLSPKQGGEDEVVEVTEEDIRAMGLDVWSQTDKTFISDMLWLWWQRKAAVRGGSIECCGVRLL